MEKSKIIVISCAIGCALLLLLLPFLWPMLGKRQAIRSPDEGASQVMSSTSAAMVLQPDANVHSNNSNMSRHQLMVLHRNKRYLLFLEGSSFQLVFDLIIPIVDYTNFAILGVTCAVAWELPSKPPSELVENLRTRLSDGTLGTVRRNGSATEEDLGDGGEQVVAGNTNWQAVQATSSSPATVAGQDQRYAYYTNVQRGQQTSAYANPSNGERLSNWQPRQTMASRWRQWQAGSPTPNHAPPRATYANRQWSDNWWQRNKARVEQSWREKQPQQQQQQRERWSFYQQPTVSSNVVYTQRPRQLLQEPPRHHIFPVFGKRRRRRHAEVDQDEDFERLHIQQHLSSRALLFGKIERLYRSRQLNGSACIQRALCESAQRQLAADADEASVQPQSFVMELLSAIFQLPKTDEVAEHMAPHYLEAHGMLGGDCRQLYGDCMHKFWFE